MSLINETDEFFTYIGSLNVNGHLVNFYNDDYGQSIFFQFIGPNGEIELMCCGTYNFNYEQEARDYINYLFNTQE